MTEFKEIQKTERSKVNGSWDNVTKQEFDYWLEDNWTDWLPDIMLDMINENKPHALADLKKEIKDAWKQSREADDEEKKEA